MNRSTSMYQDMASRTGSSIYIGVVGPVRTGKSTFIKRFMETQVLPNIENDYRRERARDELPQSGSGRTIMTAEPKFVPEEAAEVRLPDGTSFSVRLIDCVGYMVPGAVGQFEDLAPRMVMTPWYDHEIPMTEAAELGTRKVICDHSTVGIVVTTDGSVTEIPREDYLEAEERVIRELQELGKTGYVNLITRPVKRSDFDMAYRVIAATNDWKLNDEIYRVCKEEGIYVNVADDKSKCDFYFPGIYMKDEVVIGITASGLDHSRAKKVRLAIQEAMEASDDTDNSEE